MDREIIKARPIWQELPLHFKESIVCMLDAKSRCNLRSCSKIDRDLVDGCPMLIKTISLQCVSVSETRICVKFPTSAKSFENVFTDLAAVSHLLNFAKNPIMGIRRLLLEYYIIPKIMAEIRKREWKNQKIKLKSIFFKTQGREFLEQEITETLLEFVQCLDVKTIICDQVFPKEIFNEQVKLDTWKNAYGIYFPALNDFQIGRFLHLNSVRLRLETLSSDDAERLIRVFVAKKAFEHTTTFFHIYIETIITPEKILTNDDVSLKTLFDCGREGNDVRIEQFKMEHSSENYVLVVKATPTLITGSVCRPHPHLFDDFMDTPLL